MLLIENGIKREVKTLYPNIAAYYIFSPMCKEVYSDHLNITKDVFEAVIFDNEPLSFSEKYAFHQLTGMKENAINCNKIIFLDPTRKKHINMILELEGYLKNIWKYATLGCERAKTEVDGHGNSIDVRLANYIESFISGNATYSEFIIRKSELKRTSDYIIYLNEGRKNKRTRKISS